MDDTPIKRPGKGGARPGAGRPRGSKNPLPLRSTLAKERIAELLEPHLDALVAELLRIALTGEKEQDRLRAIFEAFNRAAGKSPDTIEVKAGSDAPKTVADLLGFGDQEAN